MKKNYVLIDFENVQPASIAALGAEHFEVIVFCGANQTKVPLDLAMTMQRMAPRARYLQIAGHGANALDFHIAFYIGELAAKDPAAFFHIISKDKGFDPLVAHLKTRSIFAARSASIGEIPLLKAAGAKTPDDRLKAAVENLSQRGNSRPRTIKTLTSTLSALFNKQLSEPEIATLIDRLAKARLIAIDGAKVVYSLKPAEG